MWQPTARRRMLPARIAQHLNLFRFRAPHPSIRPCAAALSPGTHLPPAAVRDDHVLSTHRTQARQPEHTCRLLKFRSWHPHSVVVGANECLCSHSGQHVFSGFGCFMLFTDGALLPLGVDLRDELIAHSNIFLRKCHSQQRSGQTVLETV